MIDALRQVGVYARREPGRIGLWTGSGSGEAKIGAIGVRVKRWVTLHGFFDQVAPDLTHFSGIVPAGSRRSDSPASRPRHIRHNSDLERDCALFFRNF